MRRANTATVAAVLLIIGLFAFFAYHQTAGVRADDTDWAMYLMHTRNIIEGQPYASTGYIYQPESTTEVGANSYPSGLPLLLLPLYAAVGLNIAAFKLFNAVFLALSLWPAYLIAKRTLHPRMALLSIAVLGFSSLYLLSYNSIGSDAPYQLVSLLVILLLLHVRSNDLDDTRPWRWGALVGLGIAIAYLIRPFGLALLLGVGGAEVLRRRKITPFLIAVGLTFVPLAVFNNLLLHTDSSYASQFTWSPRAIASHAISYLGFFSYLFANPISHLARYGLWALALPLAAFALFRRLRNGIPAPEAYLATLMGVLCVYWVPNARYLLPVMPFFIIYILEGLSALGTRLSGGQLRIMTAAAVVALLAAPASNALMVRPNARDTLVTSQAFEALADRIRQETPTDAYLVFWNPRVLSLSTGRSASGWPSEADPARVREWLLKIGSGYVVADKERADDARALLPLATLSPGDFSVTFENDRFQLIRLANPGSAPSR